MIGLVVILVVSYQVYGQCPISKAAIFLNSGGQELDNQNDLQLVIEGITTGSQATSVTWRRNGDIVDRTTIPSGGGSFFDGGGQTIVGTGPCESQIYRSALQINGYLPGNYTYSVSNVNTPSPVTSPVFVVQDPSPPTGLELRQISNRRVQATWTPPANSPGATYRVYINSFNASADGISVTGTTYTTDPLTAASTVTIHVRSTTGTYLSMSAISSTLTVIDMVVLPPTISVASVMTPPVTLVFYPRTNSLPVNTYTATLSSTTCAGVPTRTGSSTSDSVTIGSLEAGIQYSVIVTARNTNQNSLATETKTLTINETAPTGNPGVPTASVIMSTNITLTWTEIDCLERNGVITSYMIRYGEGTTRDFTISTQSSATTHVITGLKPFTQYTFTVAGVNSVGTGPFSGASGVFATIADVPSGSPGLLNSDLITSTSIRLTWTEINVSNRNGLINNYVIQYGEGTTRDRTINTQSSANTHVITGLKPFTQYTFTVAGVNSVGTGPFSSATQLITTSQDRPSAIRNVQQTLTPYSVLLLWEVPEPLNGVLVHYTIQYATNGARQAPQTTLNTAFLISNLTSNTVVSDITISATTGGGEGQTVMAADVTTSNVVSQGQSTSVCQASDYVIIVIVTVIATLALYSLILLIIVLIIYGRKKRKSSIKSAEFKMDACSAYGQVRRSDSAAQEQSSVPVGETTLYDTVKETHNNEYYS